MKIESFVHRRVGPVVSGRPVRVALLALLALGVGACSSTSSQYTSAPAIDNSTSPPDPDPRVGLRPGRTDYGQAAWNMRLVSNTPTPSDFYGVTNSDLAFLGNYVIQGNYNGFMVWDVSNPESPVLQDGYVCPASQSDVSVFQNLLFVSSESTSGRLDCGTEAPEEAVSHDRLRGVRIFDITDISDPVYLANVQTCRGSHTHSVVTEPGDDENVYIYVSGSSSVRPPEELEGCSDLAPDEDPNSALFRIEVIQVPLAAPEEARIVTSPRILPAWTPPRGARPSRPATAVARSAPGPTSATISLPMRRSASRVGRVRGTASSSTLPTRRSPGASPRSRTPTSPPGIR
ncbi:MAG: hypothetical protein GEU90_15440 [Gemmatimonas sp.]|nr:hypothetical protein [Gemmatimonas sp.]